MTGEDTGGVSAADWRAVMGYFPTGVSVVTTFHQGTPAGSTVNALCSVSLNPRLMLVCLDRTNPLAGPVPEAGVFGVNFLGADHHALAMRFARAPEGERFSDLDWERAEGGAPRLLDAPAFVDCRVETVIAAGDHLIVVGEAMRALHRPTEPPLLYHLGRFPRMPTAGAD